MATSAFGKAFREARALGEKEFTFNGKKYNTNLASDKVNPDMGAKADKAFLDFVSKRSETPTAAPTVSKKEKPMSKEDYMQSREQYKTAQDESEPSTFRKGGAVKKYASGGSVSSRADGVAQRGKTRGKIC
jgi:hypothetical protein